MASMDTPLDSKTLLRIIIKPLDAKKMQNMSICAIVIQFGLLWDVNIVVENRGREPHPKGGRGWVTVRHFIDLCPTSLTQPDLLQYHIYIPQPPPVPGVFMSHNTYLLINQKLASFMFAKRRNYYDNKSIELHCCFLKAFVVYSSSPHPHPLASRRADLNISSCLMLEDGMSFCSRRTMFGGVGGGEHCH